MSGGCIMWRQLPLAIPGLMSRAARTAKLALSSIYEALSPRHVISARTQEPGCRPIASSPTKCQVTRPSNATCDPVCRACLKSAVHVGMDLDPDVVVVAIVEMILRGPAVRFRVRELPCRAASASGWLCECRVPPRGNRPFARKRRSLRLAQSGTTRSRRDRCHPPTKPRAQTDKHASKVVRKSEKSLPPAGPCLAPTHLAQRTEMRCANRVTRGKGGGACYAPPET